MSSGYPTMKQVEAAAPYDLVRWLRFLPSPTDEQRPIMERIVARHGEIPQDKRVAASKAVGW